MEYQRLSAMFYDAYVFRTSCSMIWSKWDCFVKRFFSYWRIVFFHIHLYKFFFCFCILIFWTNQWFGWYLSTDLYSTLPAHSCFFVQVSVYLTSCKWVLIRPSKYAPNAFQFVQFYHQMKSRVATSFCLKIAETSNFKL